MPRRFEIVAESAASVDQIHAAFGREEYWLARLADDTDTTLDSLTVDADNRVDVRITQRLGRRLLPAFAAKFVPADLKIEFSETWQPLGDGNVRGESRLLASGGFGSGHSENWLTPAGDASCLRSVVEVDVKIPLAGRNLEKSIGASLVENLPVVLRFTTLWIAEHA
jgi:hypothetical protein